jgi:hypothetical protein
VQFLITDQPDLPAEFGERSSSMTSVIYEVCPLSSEDPGKLGALTNVSDVS